MRRLAPALALVVVALASARPALGEESAAPAQAAPISNLQAIVEGIAGQMGRLIADLPRPRFDLAVVLHDEHPGAARPGGRSLDDELRALLTGAISRREPLRSVRAVGGEGWEAREAARASASSAGYELLLWLEASTADNYLVIEGDLFETEHHLWRDTVEPERRVLGHVEVRRRIDAELRRYLPPLPTGPLETTSIPLGPGRYLGVAVADLDGDDLNEVILLGQRTLEIRRLQGEEAVVLTRMKLVGVPRATTRSRDPVGALVIGPRDADGLRPIAFRTSDHGQGMLVGFDGREVSLRATIGDFPVAWDDELRCSTIAPGRSEFQTAPTPCGSLDETPMVPPFYATDTVEVPQPDGSSARLHATVRANGAVVLRWNGRDVPGVSPFGTALAVTDVDDDGVAEVLLSSARDPGNPDELTILRLGTSGVSEERERIAVPGSVWIAGAGDADDDGLRELLAIAQTSTGADLVVIGR